MEKKIHLGAEFIFKLALLLLGLGVCIVSLQYGLGTMRHPGTGVFTLFLGILILIFGILDIISREGNKEHAEPLFTSNIEIKKFLSFEFSLILWIICMPYLGYVIMTFVTTFLTAKVTGLGGWFKPMLLSTVTTLFIYLLFDSWLYIDLPRGILG